MDEVERNKAVARLFIAGKTPFEQIYAPDYVHHNEAFYPGLAPGLLNFKQALASQAGGITDMDVQVDHLIGEGDKVVARFTIVGTHSGTFQGVAATGKRIRFTATDIYRFEDGRIAEGWALMDFLAFLQQAGAAPAADLA